MKKNVFWAWLFWVSTAIAITASFGSRFGWIPEGNKGFIQALAFIALLAAIILFEGGAPSKTPPKKYL